MTQLQSRKSKPGLAPVWDIVVRSVTGSGGVRPGLWEAALATGPESPGGLPGAFHFWKRHGWRFYPVNTHYFIPTAKRPGEGYPVTVLALDPAQPADDWRQAAARLCQEGALVIAVELPGAPRLTLDRQVETFLEAAWVGVALKIGGLAGSPIRLAWWGCGETAPVVEQAARLSGHKYYLPPERVLTRPWAGPWTGPYDETETAPGQTPAASGRTLAKAC